MLDDLYIQDHYYSSVRRDDHSEDDRYIVFRLQLCSRADKMSFERRSLFWYKMGELSRTVLSIKLLHAGPSHSTSGGKSSVVGTFTAACSPLMCLQLVDVRTSLSIYAQRVVRAGVISKESS